MLSSVDQGSPVFVLSNILFAFSTSPSSSSIFPHLHHVRAPPVLLLFFVCLSFPRIHHTASVVTQFLVETDGIFQMLALPHNKVFSYCAEYTLPLGSPPLRCVSQPDDEVSIDLLAVFMKKTHFHVRLKDRLEIIWRPD